MRVLSRRLNNLYRICWAISCAQFAHVSVDRRLTWNLRLLYVVHWMLGVGGLAAGRWTIVIEQLSSRSGWLAPVREWFWHLATCSPSSRTDFNVYAHINLCTKCEMRNIHNYIVVRMCEGIPLLCVIARKQIRNIHKYFHIPSICSAQVCANAQKNLLLSSNVRTHKRALRTSEALQYL